MTLIEIFDRFAPKNMALCLHLRPEKLILVGDQEQIDLFLPRCRELLAARSMQTKVTCCHVNLDKVEQTVGKLETILREENECAVDIAGGDERIVLAVGAALAALEGRQRKKVTVRKVDLETGTVKTLWGDRETSEPLSVKMTVRDMVKLQGGTLHPTTTQPAANCEPADLDGLWDLMRRNPRGWNRSITYLREFESRTEPNDQIYLSLRMLRGSIKNFDEKLTQVRGILADLRECGAIRDHSRGDSLRYSYTSPLVRACTLGPGNILENKALLEARSLRLDGKPYFQDCQMGVHIDWDGVVYGTPRIPETRNEVDLVLMRGMTPLFVSCKNGDIEEEEIYKLHTVATRFGGPHARKMLIATAIGNGLPEDRPLRKRAEDMAITLVTDAASLTGRDWAELFMQAMRPSGADATDKER